MTWIGDDETSFFGLELNRSRPRSYIRGEWDIYDIISDQAVIAQFMTGVNLSAGAWAGDHQDHSGDGRGVLLGHPLSESNFIKGFALPIGTSSDGSATQKHMEIIASAMTAGAASYKQLLRWPCYVPAGHDRVLVNIRAQDEFYYLAPKIFRYTVSGAACALTQEGSPVAPLFMPEGSGGDVWFEVPISSPGAVYVFGLDVNGEGCGVDVQVYSMRVLPLVWRYSNSGEDLASNSVWTYREACAIEASFQKTQQTIITPDADFPLSSYITYRIAANDALTYELITGEAASGQSSPTYAHDHDGDDSETIGQSLFSSCLGYPRPTVATTQVGLSSGEGDAGGCPMFDPVGVTGTRYSLGYGQAYVPVRDAGTITLNWGAVFYQQYESNPTFRLAISDDLSGAWSTSTEVAATGLGGGWRYVAGTVAGTEGALNYFRQQVRCATAKAGECLHLAGLCVWST